MSAIETLPGIQLVRADSFQGWLTEVHVGFDPRFPEPNHLSILPVANHRRFWVFPADPGNWPHFVCSLLNGLDKWTYGYLYPQFGTWPNFDGSSDYLNEKVSKLLLSRFATVDGWSGPIRFEESAQDALITFCFVSMIFAGDDMYFVPEHARQIIQIDHHGVIHAQCISEDDIQALVAHMSALGYDLPSELPDATFRRPNWMSDDP